MTGGEKNLRAQLRRAAENPGAFAAGDVLAVHRRPSWWRPNTWVSWRIQGTTHEKGFVGVRWNHVGLLFWSGREWRVIEALFRGGVVDRPLTIYGDPRRYVLGVYGCKVPSFQRIGIVGFGRLAVGSRYAVRKIVAIRALQMAGFDPWNVDEWRREVLEESYICSGLVVKAYRQVDIDLCGSFGSPRRVAEAMDRQEWLWGKM